MMRKVIALFDEYQSKENAKHVIRSMKENARQGFWNGATAPLGYKLMEARSAARRSRRNSTSTQSKPKRSGLFSGYICTATATRVRSASKSCQMAQPQWLPLTQRQHIRRRQRPQNPAPTPFTSGDGGSIGPRQRPANESLTMKSSRFRLPAIIDPAMFEQVQRQLHARNPKGDGSAHDHGADLSHRIGNFAPAVEAV